MSIWIALAMILVGILAIYAEFFVPAFGVIGIGGVIVVLAAVILAFRDLPQGQAIAVLMTAIFVVPAALIFLLHRFSRSFLGRRLILKTQSGGVIPAGSGNESLVGRSGEALTSLHPAGYALIDGTRTSVVTDGEFLERSTPVVVVAHEGARIVVGKKGGSHDV
jgi:membrane-bound serine protease (ClpP class)